MDKILEEDLNAVKEFMNEKIKNDEHKFFTGDASELKVVQVINVIEELERLQEENNNLKIANNVLEKRVRRLLKSKTIRDFDVKNYFTNKYKCDIKDLDKCVVELCKYYQYDFEFAILTGHSIEKLINLILNMDIEIFDKSVKGII